MKALILVGGEGTRLRPLTLNTTKAMVPVLNRPFLEHLLGCLKKHGINDIILAMGYLPHRIKDYFGNGAGMGVRLTYLIEKGALGTAGAVKNAAGCLDGAFLMLNGDIFTDLDINAMIDFHRRCRATVTIATTPVEDPAAYGLIETGAGGRISCFREKPRPEEITTNMINAGIYVLEPEILALIPPEEKVSIERETFQQLLAEEAAMYAYPSTTYWLDMGTPEKYLRLNHDLLLGKAFSPIETAEGGRSRIEPSAEIKAPVLIGEGCVIGRGVKLTGPSVLGAGCQIEEGASLEGTVLWDGVKIGKGAALNNCIAASNSEVRSGSLLPEGCVLGEGVVVDKNSQMAPGTRIPPA